MSTWNELADKMLATDGPAALVCRQWLMPAEGRDAVIFPPTFAAPEGGGKDGYKIDADLGSATLKVESRRENSGKAGYNIDEVRDANDPNKVTRIAIIDTVGSQANRMEPLFKRANGEDTPYSRLVPQIEIKAGNKIVNLLDAGHRAADAIVRYSSLGPTLKEAFNAYQESGDATELAKIAPTSLVFGAWDSRGTQAKLPRIVASTIRAYDITELQRSAQYFPPIDYVKEELFDDEFLETTTKGGKKIGSAFGLKAAPAEGTHGGVIVRGEIRREAILNLVCLRAIGPKGQTGDALRRYILGLALVAISYDRPHDLRQGCLLVKDPDRPSRWEVVFNDGSRQEVAPDGSALLAFAQKAADDFGERKSGRYEFLDPDRARAEVEKEMEEKGSKKGKSRKGKNGDSNQ
jgi:CRISPR-associated protein Csb1